MHDLHAAWAAIDHHAHLLGTWARNRLAGQAGEGVISTAIEVLIMALIGAAMWVAFSGVFDSARQRTTDNVNQIGS